MNSLHSGQRSFFQLLIVEMVKAFSFTYGVLAADPSWVQSEQVVSWRQEWIPLLSRSSKCANQYLDPWSPIETHNSMESVLVRHSHQERYKLMNVNDHELSSIGWWDNASRTHEPEIRMS